MIENNNNKEFAFVRCDIDKFSLINSFWGNEEGDRVLKHLADVIRKMEDDFGLCTYGRINGDIFCLCITYSEKAIKKLIECVKSNLEGYNKNYFIKPKFGIYIDRDHSDPVEVMHQKHPSGRTDKVLKKTCR